MSDFGAALDIFTQETEELLAQMEDGLLVLEDDAHNVESINNVFRAMHTIKGTSGLFGLDEVVAFSHEVESVLDKIRHGECVIEANLISILLNCKDHTASLIKYCLSHESEELTETLRAIGIKLITQLTSLSGSDLPTSLVNAEAELESASVFSIESHQVIDDNWIITLKFRQNALRNGIDPLSFINYLGQCGQIREIQTLTPDLPPGLEFDPETCYLEFNIIFHSALEKQAIADIFEFAEDDCDIRIIPPNSKIEQYLNLLKEQEPDSHGDIEKLGEMLVNIGALTHNEVANALRQQDFICHQESMIPKPLGEILVELQFAEQPVVAQALLKQQGVRDKTVAESNYIRVDSAKLGQIINLVGELVISGAAMRLLVERYGLSDVEEVAVGMNELVSEIRDTALKLRMVAIGETFSRFRRIVRDVGNELNKQIELVITGGETELDKTVVEKINDPLTHLIRNALDHGIERPAQRVAAGKPAQGTVHLNAYHDSGHIVIQVADDGAGLNSDKILAKALAQGLVSADQELSRQEIFNLIFEAGLSTKEQANNLSGRGVGMDVVRRNIELLRGTVDLDSIEGRGTTVTIRLPLTLAIIDGFMVETEGERYIIPLSMIEECVELNAEEWQIDSIHHYINLRGEVLPYLRLGDYFHDRSRHCQSNGHRESLVVVRFGQAKVGLVVDQLHGEHQTVIKPLGQVFEQLQGISGATVLGNGEVALILDVQALIQYAVKPKGTNGHTSAH